MVDMLIDLETVGGKIRQSRLHAAISQAEFARMADVSRATINGIENGTVREIGVNRLNRIVSVSQNLRLSAGRTIHSDRKSASLNLSFPYDWSNSAMPDALMIAKVVERGLFEDMVKVAVHYGVAALRSAISTFIAKNPAAAPSLNRMLRNIETGLHVAS
jgi:DNA-binding XRE family transcriptional regulator